MATLDSTGKHSLLESTDKEGNYHAPVVIHPTMRKIDCSSTVDRYKKEYVWNTEDLLGCVLVPPFPVIKVNGQLKQTNPDSTTDSPDPSGMKVWISPPRKEPWPPEVFAWGQRKYGKFIEGGSYKYKLWPHDQLQTRGECNGHEYFFLILL